MTSTRNGTPTPTLDITTAAVRNPGVTVELEPGVSGDGREIRKSNYLYCMQDYRCTGIVLPCNHMKISPPSWAY